MRGETESTKCLVSKVGKQHPHLGHHDSSLLPFLGGGFFQYLASPQLIYSYLDEASAPQRQHVMHLQVSIYVAAKNFLVFILKLHMWYRILTVC